MKFIPHDYQKFATEFICENPESLMILDMGLGSQNCRIADSNNEADV